MPEHFDDDLAELKHVELEIAYDTSNRQAEMGLRPLRQLLTGYSQEKLSLNLMMRGISSDVMQSVGIKERHLTRGDERKVTITAMLPMVL